MAATVESICNSALAKVGATSISSISGTDKKSVLCNLLYSKVRDKVLKAHPWNFAIKRARLAGDVDTFVDGDVTVGTDSIAETAHGRLSGDRCMLSTTGTLPTGLSADTEYYFIKVDADNFKLAETYDEAIAGTAITITAAAGGGTHTIRYMPAFGWDYQYVLPADYLRVLSGEDDDSDFAIEGSLLLCNDDSFKIKYIAQITDVTAFPADFDELLAWYLAYELAFPLVQSNTLKNTLKSEMEQYIRDARSFDAQEGTPENFDYDEWLDARL